MKTRCGLAARIIPIAGLPGSNTARPACWRKCAAIAIGDAHTKIRMQRAEAEIEQDGIAILARGARVGAEFGQRGAPAHRAIGFRQAQRDALIPAGLVMLSDARAGGADDA